MDSAYGRIVEHWYSFCVHPIVAQGEKWKMRWKKTLSLPLHPPLDGLQIYCIPYFRRPKVQPNSNCTADISLGQKQLLYLWTLMVRTSLCFEQEILRTRTPTCSPEVPRLMSVSPGAPPTHTHTCRHSTHTQTQHTRRHSTHTHYLHT